MNGKKVTDEHHPELSHPSQRRLKRLLLVQSLDMEPPCLRECALC